MIPFTVATTTMRRQLLLRRFVMRAETVRQVATSAMRPRAEGGGKTEFIPKPRKAAGMNNPSPSAFLAPLDDGLDDEAYQISETTQSEEFVWDDIEAAPRKANPVASQPLEAAPSIKANDFTKAVREVNAPRTDKPEEPRDEGNESQEKEGETIEVKMKFIYDMKVKELKEVCRKEKLKVSGKKAELQERLVDFYRQAGDTPK